MLLSDELELNSELELELTGRAQTVRGFAGGYPVNPRLSVQLAGDVAAARWTDHPSSTTSSSRADVEQSHNRGPAPMHWRWV